MEFKDLDKALIEEKANNKRLAEELNKTKSEANYYKTEGDNHYYYYIFLINLIFIYIYNICLKIMYFSVLQLKKSIKTSDNQQFRKPFNLFDDHNNVVNEIPVKSESQLDKSTTSFQRMHHNIPHRFLEVTNKLKAKCVSCADTIFFGKILKCSECGATSHPKCAEMLPNNCGLPVEMMQHLFLNSNDVNDNHFDDLENSEDLVEVQELEPSAPEAHSPINNYDSSDSSATTDNNESFSEDHTSQAFGTRRTDSNIRQIEAICAEEEGFSFTDSMLDVLENKQK